MTRIRAGFIGLGAMGEHMARHLARQGLLAAVWNRTPDKAARLAEESGCRQAESPAQLAAAVDIILTCVSADSDLQSVVEQCLPGLRAGTVLVDTSTVSPGTTVRLAQRLNRHGVEVADAPVSGGVEGAKNGRLVSMVGAGSATFGRVQPVIAAYSASVTHMGPVGSGQAAKAVNQVIVAGVAEAVCEALALAEQLDLPREPLLSVLSAGAADGWFLRHRGPSMLENHFSVGFKQSLLLKDLWIVHDLAQQLKMPVPLVEAAIEDYTALVAAGEGDLDISGLIRRKRPDPYNA